MNIPVCNACGGRLKTTCRRVCPIYIPVCSAGGGIGEQLNGCNYGRRFSLFIRKLCFLIQLVTIPPNKNLNYENNLHACGI